MSNRQARRLAGWLLGVWVSAMAAGCTPTLPDAESAGAQLYADRCGGCHRLYAPESMKAEMWKVQVERMQGEMVRRGVPALTPAERDTLLTYLRRYAA